MDAATADLDEEEHIEFLQEEGVDGEEVAGDELVSVVGHQRAPTGVSSSIWGWHDAVATKDVGDGLSADPESKLVQFALDFAEAPLGHKNTVAVELLDAMVVSIRYINIAATVHGHTVGILELAVATTPTAPLG